MTGRSSYLPPFSPDERDEHAARTGARLDDAHAASTLSDGRTSDGTMSDGRTSDGRTSDGMMSDGRMSDGGPLDRAATITPRRPRPIEPRTIDAPIHAAGTPTRSARDDDERGAAGPDGPTYADFLGDQVDD